MSGAEYVPRRTHWVTREGQRIKITELSDAHLGNILRMLVRGAEADKSKYFTTGPEAEMASLDFECGLEELAEMSSEEYVAEEHPELVEEAERRGLKWQPE